MAKTATAPKTKASPAAALKAAKGSKKAAAAPVIETPIEDLEVELPEVELPDAEDAKSLTGPTIYEEVLELAKNGDPAFVVGQGAKEMALDYLGRMVRAAIDGHDDVYNAMSEPAQAWFNAAATAVTSNKPCATPEGFEPIQTGGAAKAGKMDGLRAHQAKVKADKAAAIARGEVPAPKTKAPKAAKEPKGDGLVGTIRRLVFDNPGLTVAQAHDAVTKLGLETALGTVSTTRAGSLDALIALRDKGMLNPAMLTKMKNAGM